MQDLLCSGHRHELDGPNLGGERGVQIWVQTTSQCDNCVDGPFRGGCASAEEQETTGSCEDGVW